VSLAMFAARPDLNEDVLLDSLLVEQTSRIRAARDVSVPSDAQSMISIPVARVSFIQHISDFLSIDVRRTLVI
jgi:hypothetical protein